MEFCLVVLIATLFFDSHFVRADATSILSSTFNIPFIGRVNSDTLQDLIFSKNTTFGGNLPNYIVYGQIDTLNHVYYDSTSHYTKFVYPNWQFLRGGFYFKKVNQDNYEDLIIYFRGMDTTDQLSKDTSEVVVLFQQPNMELLDTIKIINIATLLVDTIWTDSLHYIYSYIARLSGDYGLSNPEQRDYSGLLSYIVNQVNVNIYEEQLKIKPIGKDSITSENRDIRLNSSLLIQGRTYPNPAREEAFIEFDKIPEGIYQIGIRTVEGKEIFEKQIFISSTSIYNDYLDLKDLASGCYIVYLRKEGAVPSRFPLVIIH
ncbi:MAG: hypothetical protein NT007_07085 [Candidatus Kapabacteria bacterium]|nr:hypothetical protein [Candidatus Kapabacteria bacterium]